MVKEKPQTAAECSEKMAELERKIYVIHQESCKHPRLLVEMDSNGHIWDVRCRKCHKIFARTTGYDLKEECKAITRWVISEQTKEEKSWVARLLS